MQHVLCVSLYRILYYAIPFYAMLCYAALCCVILFWYIIYNMLYSICCAFLFNLSFHYLSCLCFNFILFLYVACHENCLFRYSGVIQGKALFWARGSLVTLTAIINSYKTRPFLPLGCGPDHILAFALYCLCDLPSSESIYRQTVIYRILFDICRSDNFSSSSAPSASEKGSAPFRSEAMLPEVSHSLKDRLRP